MDGFAVKFGMLSRRAVWQVLDGSCRLLLPLAFVKMGWFILYFIFVQPCVNGSFRREVWYAQSSCGLAGA